MAKTDRTEAAIRDALARACAKPAPAKLAEALRYAVLPGGARIRPTISMAVARACGDDAPHVTDAVGAAIELIHCASLVHDDLPAFDDADLRRGKPSVHAAYGEALAVLAGDALIIEAFAVIARAATTHPLRGLHLTTLLAANTGMPTGICAGQGWESEAQVDLSAYHRSKTGALFIAATCMGAVAAGEQAEPWAELGARIGEAFQVADDLRDTLLDEDALGKPAGQDAVHDRPNAVQALGVTGAVQRLDDILGGAIASIPSCPGEAQLCEMVRRQAAALMPVSLVRHVV